MMGELSIVKLKQILRAHFKQKSATELYQELSVLRQEADESAQDFLVKAMDLRQQIIMASKMSDSPVRYNTPLVQGLFQHVLETGFIQESVRAKLRPLLERDQVSDEDLMKRVNLAVSAEAERHNKFAVRQGGQVNAAMVEDVNAQSQLPKKDSKEGKESKLAAALDAVRADVASLREVVDKALTQDPANTNPPGKAANTPRKPRRKCQKCQDNGEQYCDHCFKCGSQEHFARGCRKGKSEGNDNRLQPWDRK